MKNPEQLIAAYLDSALSESERAELNTWLKADAVNLRRFTEAAMFEQQIRTAAHASAEQHAAEDFAPSITHVKPRSRWLQWRPLMAAAAGIVFGVFCTSVVFAYVAPSLGKVITLLQESFESGPAPLITGVPMEPGRWSGDFTEVVDAQQGVQPEEGKKMLRFLREDYEGKPNTKGSHVADIYRLIDVRPHRQEFADGSVVVQLSAAFNALGFSSGETYSSRMTIHAFDAESVANGTLRKVSAWDEHCLATASTGATRLDRNPATWQRMSMDLRLPANTDFLLIHLMIPAGTGTNPETRFGGHYVDDVLLTLHHRPLK